jgi:tetratricopeptide (TPR) repeat protein
MALKADYPNVHNDLGDIYHNLSRDNEALEEYRKEIAYCQIQLAQTPQDPVTLNNLAYAYNGAGDAQKAKEIIDKVIASWPKYRQAYLTSAKIYELMGKANEAQGVLLKARSLSTETNFIDSGLARLNKGAATVNAVQFVEKDTVYLKNGRQIRGRIKDEDAEKVALDVKIGNTFGCLVFYRNTIERIERSDEKIE